MFGEIEGLDLESEYIAVLFERFGESAKPGPEDTGPIVDESGEPVTTYVDRMIVEYVRLRHLLRKLEAFIPTHGFTQLAEEDQDLLMRQRQSMREYLSILNARLDRAANT